jgi:hypothetical protein
MTQETFAEMARRHREADMLVDGRFEMIDGQACSIGCFCHDYGLEPGDYEELAKLTGYPEDAHRLQEAIFEGLPEAERADWHVAFADKAASVTDWQTVIDRTVLASLRVSEAYDTSTGKTVSAVIALYERRLNGDNPSVADWAAVGEAEDAAWDAYAAWVAARAVMRAHTWAGMNAARADASEAIVYAVGATARGAVAVWRASRDAAGGAAAVWRASWDAAGDAADAAREDAWVKIRDAFLNA